MGFDNLFYCSGDLLSDTTYLTYVFAHEFGHIVHAASWTHNSIYGTSFVSEGFASYFGEQVCHRLGMDYDEHHHIETVQNDHFLEQFSGNLQRGLTDSDAFFALKDNIVMEPEDCYTFGYFFWKYLHETYGDDCLKKLSQVIMPQVQASFESGDELWRNVNDLLTYDQDAYFDLYRQAFGEDVFTSFPAWVAAQE